MIKPISTRFARKIFPVFPYVRNPTTAVIEWNVISRIILY